MLVLLAGCGSKPAELEDEWTAQACAAATLTGNDPRQRSATAALERALAEDAGPGATAAVVIDGKLVWSDALGTADGASPLTPAAQIRIGSVAKVFTATMLADVAAAGRVDLDAPIQTYVPEFPRKEHEISLRQLATHTSGLRHYDFSKLSEANNKVHYAKLGDALALFADDPLVAAPGSAVHYTSFGYNLIGVALENVLQEGYGRALRRLVGDPLRLKSVDLDDAGRRIPCRPTFYTNLFGRFTIETFWRDSSDYYPSGGLLATSEDLARFAHAMFATEALTAEARALLTQPASLADGTARFAFGWEVRKDAAGNVVWYGSGGAANGAHASVRYYPSQRMAVAGAINYNFWLTGRRPAFFRAIRDEIPAVYGAKAD